MAVIGGTNGSDFIHRAGDGHSETGHEITGVTTGDDTIAAGRGADIVYADKGNDIFVCAVRDIDGLAEEMYGGKGTDDLRIEAGGGSDIDLTGATISSVERLVIAPAESDLYSITMTPEQLAGFSVIAGIENDFGVRSLIIHLTETANLDLSGLSYGFTEIFGTNGNDKLKFKGDFEWCTFLGGNGNDTITVDTDNETGAGIIGGDGNDHLTGKGDFDFFNCRRRRKRQAGRRRRCRHNGRRRQ